MYLGQIRELSTCSYDRYMYSGQVRVLRTDIVDCSQKEYACLLTVSTFRIQSTSVGLFSLQNFSDQQQ